MENDMKRTKRVVVAASALMLALLFCQTGFAVNAPAKKIDLGTERARVSYAIGVTVGINLREIKDTIQMDVLVQAINDVLAGDDKIQMDQQSLRTTLTEFQKKTQQAFAQKQKTAGDKNRVEGEKFLRDNAKKPGITVTASGLQYKVIRMGTGPTPKASDVVKIHYRGMLINGTEFDSSYKRNEPVTFPLNKVIPAWSEGVRLMKVGSKYLFYAPAALAYGDKGAGSVIAPNAVLVFDIELLGIEKPAAAANKPSAAK
jgi:FKBP-type peptidyl-prolyl cis-trans isomerase FkpA